MKKHDKRLQDQAFAESNIKKKGMTVTVYTNRFGEPDINNALKELKKRMNKEGIFREMRTREYYESKGSIRRRKKAEAVRRFRRESKERLQEEGY